MGVYGAGWCKHPIWQQRKDDQRGDGENQPVSHLVRRQDRANKAVQRGARRQQHCNCGRKASRKCRPLDRQCAQQDSEDKGNFCCQTGVVPARPPIGKSHEPHNAGGQGGEQQCSADSEGQSSAQSRHREGAYPGWRSRIALTLAPLALGSDEKADAEGDRKVQDDRFRKRHAPFYDEIRIRVGN